MQFVWQDRRTSDICNKIRETHGEIITEKTGLEVEAYFSASKIKKMLDNVPVARLRALNGDLAFGTVDTWLIWRFTNGKLHITDPSNASRTMLNNNYALDWDNELLDIFDIPHMLLPEVHSSSEIYGEIATPHELSGIKIAGVAGDQQAALFGQACFDTGSTKNTYGTGCFMPQNVGERPVVSHDRRLSTVCWQINGRIEYALKGSVFIGGQL